MFTDKKDLDNIHKYLGAFVKYHNYETKIEKEILQNLETNEEIMFKQINNLDITLFFQENVTIQISKD